MTITSIPLQTESAGQLGKSKTDGSGTYDADTKISAAQWNQAVLRLIAAYQEIGLSDGSTANSLNARVADLEVLAPTLRVASGSTATVGPADIGNVIALDYSGTVATLLTDCSSAITAGRLNTITIIVATALTRMNLSLDSGIGLNDGAWSPLTGIGTYELQTTDGLNWLRASKREISIGHILALFATGVASLDVNSQKITSLANGSGAQDAAAFGQIPTASAGTPAAVATSGAAGSASTWSKSDHVHAVTAATLITAMASAASALAMNAQKITGLADGTSATDAAAFGQLKVSDVLVKTAAYTLLTTDSRIIQVDDTAGRVDLTLPAPSSKRVYTIQKIAGTTGGVRLIRNGSEKIMTVAASYDLPGATTAFSSTTPQAWLVYSDGTDWWVA